MIERAWTTIDKSGWPPGPWLDEPDKLQFTHAMTRLPCLLLRDPRGGDLCGYVGVPPGHPWHGRPEHEITAAVVGVHGGEITFAGGCQPGDVATAICHVPEPGEPDQVWWLGFDCGHALDIKPAEPRYIWPEGLPRAGYRDLVYVRRQCGRLARQAMRAVVWEPAALTAAQRCGDECVACGKRWPRPRVPVGRFPDGTCVWACWECAPVLAAGHASTTSKER